MRLVAASLSTVPTALAEDKIEPSVVKLIVTKREPDYFRPWTKAAPEKVSGSGVVIDGKRILTNAHVVMHASQVFVQMRRGGDQLNAKVKAIGPGIDLAIVELVDPATLKDVPAIPLADELPQLKSHVSVYGYPAGGDDLSVTDGIVSRIEFTSYNFASGGVRVQVDAALNPGNSGGPAINEGKIVGLVFSKINEAENIGYLIPTDEIREFLKHAKDGKYEGNMLLLDEYQTAENEALRKFLKIPDDVTGVVITRPYSDDKDYPLKQWDVVTHVGTHAIDNQGYVDVRDGLRMRFLYYVARDGEGRENRSDDSARRREERSFSASRAAARNCVCRHCRMNIRSISFTGRWCSRWRRRSMFGRWAATAWAPCWRCRAHC